MPTVTARPVKATKVAWILAVLVVVVFSAVATTLRGPTDSGKSVFQTGDQVAMIGLGILGALGILLFTRPRVSADADRIRIRNVIGSYELPWDVVRSVEFRRGSPWASLELENDDVVAVMAVQAADKEYAVAAVRGLRALLATAHRTGSVLESWSRPTARCPRTARSVPSGAARSHPPAVTAAGSGPPRGKHPPAAVLNRHLAATGRAGPGMRRGLPFGVGRHTWN